MGAWEGGKGRRPQKTGGDWKASLRPCPCGVCVIDNHDSQRPRLSPLTSTLTIAAIAIHENFQQSSFIYSAPGERRTWNSCGSAAPPDDQSLLRPSTSSRTTCNNRQTPWLRSPLMAIWPGCKSFLVSVHVSGIALQFPKNRGRNVRRNFERFVP